MIYIFVKWIHNFIDEPVFLYSELDEARFEIRKVEIFQDGKKSYASKSEETETTWLGIEPVPNISEIAKDPEFEPEEISQEEFERVWSDRKKVG
ncbi:MAG: hypothetical protein P4L50_29295 [Anaerolineaceae bacterium]|nr:hypothetical protein [Anaerolineaceae bacterium]